MTNKVNSLADLPKIPAIAKILNGATQKKPRKIKDFDMVAPFYINKLVKEIGATEAGKAIGVTSGSLSESIRKNTARRVTEGAARGYYEREVDPSHKETVLDGNVLVTVLLPKEAFAAIKPWLTDAGATVKVFSK